MRQHEQATAALMGAAIAEAMGMPWETMTREQILVHSGLGVSGFHDPGVRDPAWGVFGLGETGDDAQLTAASARSLVRHLGFNAADVAQESVMEMERSTAGWGPTTREGFEAIALWFRTKGAEGRRPDQFVPAAKPGRGLGNGVMMRVLPHAIFSAVRYGGHEINLQREIWSLGHMTHSDPRASIAAYAIADLAVSIFTREKPVGQEGPEDVQNVLVGCLARVMAMEKWTGSAGMKPDISDLLHRVRDLDRSDADAARREFGCDCPVTSSLPFVVATFCRHPLNYREAVLEAINAGGDTDTNASIVGGLVAANAAVENGIGAIPRQWREFRPSYQDVGILGHNLVSAAVFAKTAS